MPTNSRSERVALSIREKLRTADISQEVLATHLGISQQAVSRRLTGEVEFSGSQLIEIAEFLATSLDELAAEPALAGGDAA